VSYLFDFHENRELSTKIHQVVYSFELGIFAYLFYCSHDVVHFVGKGSKRQLLQRNLCSTHFAKLSLCCIFLVYHKPHMPSCLVLTSGMYVSISENVKLKQAVVRYLDSVTYFQCLDEVCSAM